MYIIKKKKNDIWWCVITPENKYLMLDYENYRLHNKPRYEFKDPDMAYKAILIYLGLKRCVKMEECGYSWADGLSFKNSMLIIYEPSWEKYNYMKEIGMLEYPPAIGINAQNELLIKRC